MTDMKRSNIVDFRLAVYHFNHYGDKWSAKGSNEAIDDANKEYDKLLEAIIHRGDRNYTPNDSRPDLHRL